MKSKSPIFDRLMNWCEKNNVHCRITIEGATECAWSCEIGVTLKSTIDHRPDRSHIVFLAGLQEPGDGLDTCAKDIVEWLNINLYSKYPTTAASDPTIDVCNSNS